MMDGSDQGGGKYASIQVAGNLVQKLRLWPSVWRDVSWGSSALLAPSILTLTHHPDEALNTHQVSGTDVMACALQPCFIKTLPQNRSYDPSPRFSQSHCRRIYANVTRQQPNYSWGHPDKGWRAVQRLPQCWVTPVLLTGFVLLLGGEATSGKLLVSCCSLWTPLGTGIWSCKPWLDLQSKLSLWLLSRSLKTHFPNCYDYIQILLF